MISLRPYQRASVDAAWNFMRARPGNPCIVLPTGAGKTIVLAEMIREALTAWPGTRICVLAHVRELVQQNAEKLRTYWPEAPLGIYSASLNRRDRFEPVIFASIQSVANKAMTLGRFDLLLIDEAHRIPLRAEGQYRQFIDDCLRANPNLRICGLTATPYRLGGGPVCGPDYILNEIAYEARVKDLIRDGYLSRLVSKAGIARADLSGVQVRNGEYAGGQLERACNITTVVEAACDEIVSYCADRRAWIVFAAGIAHAEHVATALSARGIACAQVDGKTPAGVRAAHIEAFQSGELRALVNVNVLSEGFDATHVDAVVLLRPTKSAALYYQQCLDDQTEILTQRGWMRRGAIGMTDLVAAASWASEVPEMSWEHPTEIIDREVPANECMVSISAPGVDFRVTGGHEMIVTNRRSKEGWKKKTAQELLKLKSDFRIPVATVERSAGAPLTDDEIRFIGWFLTDGNLNKYTNAITISQSSAQPWFAEIELCLKACGFKYGKHLIKSRTQFNESAPRYIFTVSKGMPRGRDKHLSGWARLEQYIDKDLSAALDQLDQRQFEILLNAIHLGDGSKRANATWTRRSYSIATVNREFADRLQSLCLRRGWRCNIATTKCRDTTMLGLHIKKQHFRAVGGSSQNDRSTLAMKAPVAGERVWCVRVPSGAFIARRNGKAFVTGNCGRGMRLHPGKADCLVLDFAGNIIEHGPVDAIRPPKKPGQKATSEAPMRECPQCHGIVPVQTQVCPDCGYQFPRSSFFDRHDATASDAPILSDEIVPPVEHRVTGIRYDRHEKPGKPTSLRVTYTCGLRIFREWVCLEHGGIARAKAMTWWMQRDTEGLTPRTVDAALERTGRLRTPSTIRVSERGKYPEIVDVSFDDPSTAQSQDRRAA